MRKSKILIIVFIIILCGCNNISKDEKRNIKTTAYPIEYITTSIYGKEDNITSIYPNGSDYNYEVSNKLLNDYSNTDIFIFNGEYKKEKTYVYEMINNNSKLKIIDVAQNLTYKTDIAELWLDPMNLLTMANNIKKGFKEYLTSSLFLKNIDDNYNNLKLSLIQLDADYRDCVNKANNKTIIVGNDLYNYLTKYGIKIISLEESDNLTNKIQYNAENLIKNGTIKYIYVKKDTKLNDNIKSLINKYKVEVIELHPLFTLTDEEKNSNKNYITISYENLEKLKKQLY